MARVAVLGSINMDLVTTCTHLPAPGQTVLGDQHLTSPGGKGANQAVAAARCGAHTWLIGAVGNDSHGAQLRANLAASGVHDTHLRTVPGASGIAAVSVDQAGENSIIVVGGANRSVTTLTPADRALIADCDVLLCQLELPLAVVEDAAALAHSRGVTVMLNPSPAQPLPTSLLSRVDVLVANEGEVELLGRRRLVPVRHLVTTLGARGARYRGPAGFAFHLAAPPVDAVDTTGAGDTFAGVLAAMWNQDPLSALEWAVAAGALATTRRGAHAPTAHQIADHLATAEEPARRRAPHLTG